MTTSVLAAVKTDVERLTFVEYERPDIPDDSGLLRVESCGVGGSDPEAYRKPGHAPIIMGHEIVGVIEAVGDSAARRWGVAVGDRVALQEYLPCWVCKWCRRGDFRLCVQADFFLVKDTLRTPRFGMSSCEAPPHLMGGFARHVFLPWNTVIHKLPQGIPARHATLAIPFGNGVQWACLDGGAGPGKAVLVIGPGQQGLGCVLAAKASGAFKVILAGQGRDASRLELARDLGADEAVDVEQDDLADRVLHATGGEGVDVVVDTTGDPTGEVAAVAVKVAAKGAWLSLNGLGQTVPIGEIKRRYLTVRAPRGHSYEAIEQALRLVASGRYPIDAVCSHDFGLTETDLAIRATAGKGVEGAVHVTVDPWR